MAQLPQNIVEYSSFVSAELAKLFTKEGLLNDQLIAAMEYSLLAGGKRFRPYLVLRVCEVCGGNRENALIPAMALECIHTYSLIHDDLPCLDDDELRRGIPTCHKKFDEPTALLAGDGLLTFAFELLAKANLPADNIVRLVGVLAGRSGYQGMVGGQMADYLGETMKPSESTMYYIHEHKTADLITAAAEMGAICASVSDEELEKWRNFGFQCGIAFQVSDDVCDVISTSEEMGKMVGKDADSGKQNAAVIFGLEKAKALALETSQKAWECIAEYEDRAEDLKKLLQWLPTRRK